MLYAVCLIGSFAFGFNAFQGNTIASAVNDSLGVERLWTGLALAAVTGFIVYGGIKRIAKVADVVVPVMALSYIAVALVIILMNLGELPRVFGTILANAFGLEEAVSGGMGAAIAQGLRRGLFSNEAGLGSAPNAAATADVYHPMSQGITQSLSVFIDTILICSAFSDPLMGLLALVNLMAVLMLFPVAMRVLNDYRDQLKAGIDRPVFDAAKFPDLNIDHAAWKIRAR